MNKILMKRRRFISNTFVGGAGIAAYLSPGMQFAKAAAVGGTSDYKALVCVYLNGGNDSYNMLTPLYGDMRVKYEQVRGNVARPLGLEIFPNGVMYGEGGLGLDVTMPKLKALFDQKKLAIQGNVGPLIEPVVDTLGNEIRGSAKPKGLFAHDASTQNWMRGADLAQKSTGWGGRMLDTVIGETADAKGFLHNISLGGGNFWQAGNAHSPYSIPRSGKISTRFMDAHHHGGRASWMLSGAIKELRKSPQSDHLLQSAYSNLLERSIQNNLSLVEDIANVDDSATVFPPGNGLAQDLKAVSKLIEIGRNNGLTRQVFYVSIGGFDTHNNQNGAHPNLLATLSDAMAAFYDFTVEKGLENNITTFTMSEFGRSLRSNGDGTDHGWAGHQFVLGGAVNGGKIYGDVLEQKISTKMIPTTANEQMFASLAKWYGVGSDNLNDLFPNLSNFSDRAIDYF